MAARGARVPSRIARVVDQATPTGNLAIQLGVVGPGGSGAGEVLDALAERLSSEGASVLRLTGRRLERDRPLAALHEVVDEADLPPEPEERHWRELLLARLGGREAALLVDEAQWLDPTSLRVVVGVAERADDRDVTVVAAHRPAPGDPELAALDAALARQRPLVWLGPLDEADVAERAALVLGSAVEPALVDALHEQSAGVQRFVDHLARAWAHRGPDLHRQTATPEAPGTGNRPLDASVVEAVRAEVDQLPPTPRTVLAALSAGADLDDDLLGSVTGLAPGELGEAVEALRATGLVVADRDEVVPVVAAAVQELTPVADRRRFHALLAAALNERGAPPARAAEHLAAAEMQGQEAAAAYVAAGDACLTDAPELARAWFERAAAAGAPPHTVAARRAEAAALDGDAGPALRLADAALGDPATPDKDRARTVVAALLPARGFWSRAAAAYGELAEAETEAGPDAEAEAAEPGGGAGPWSEPARVLRQIAALVSGAPSADKGDDAPRRATASLELEAMSLAARGLAASVGGEAAEALTPFLEAAELLEASHTRLLLPDSPHAIGASVALALSELTAAEHLLTRAIEADVGGRALRNRHRLLLGWVAVRTGRWATAQGALDDTRELGPLTPREQLLAAAIAAGLARRAGDLSRLGEAWRLAEGVLLRHPADLLVLDPIGELAIAASRLGLWERVSGKARELGDVLRQLGGPPLWTLPLRWTGLQVALASEDHEAAVRRAAEVEAVTPVHPRLGALADAARAWVEVLAGRAEPAQVTEASQGLQGLGLTWEASRLAGQAAIRSPDPSVTRALLEQARDLKSALPSAEADEAPAAPSLLSEREQMVAQHIVDGLTYKEIGAQLYISPKTVEHHVAKIRQKLGATTRAEMLAALRTQLP